MNRKKSNWQDFRPNAYGYMTREVAGLNPRFFVAQQGPRRADIIESERGETYAMVILEDNGLWELRVEYCLENEFPAFHPCGKKAATPEEAVLFFNRFFQVLESPWLAGADEAAAYGMRSETGFGKAGFDAKGRQLYHYDLSLGHKDMVLAAYRDGKPVPSDVLHEYGISGR